MMYSFPALLLGPLSWWTILVWLAETDANTLPGPQDCDLARAKCSYRATCYKALHSYMVDCADVLSGRTTRCPWACQRALISLTSTEYGLTLSTCDCGDNEFCRRSKERIEVCRPEVSYATADDTIVPCSVAKWICAADNLCSTALDFYHRLCRPMFHGRKCTPRCNNSLAILDRQEKAGKLRDCYCDGSEDFPCRTIKQNTQKLCYGREEWNGDYYQPTTTANPQSGCGGSGNLNSFAFCLCLCFSFISVLLELRTSDVGKERTDLQTDVERKYLNCVLKKEALFKRTGQWPWWWTSEILR